MDNQNDEAKKFSRMKLRDHIELRPDTYIGADFGFKEHKVWLSLQTNGDEVKYYSKFANARLPMSMISISKEIFDNATDNAERSRVEKIDPGTIDVTMTAQTLTVRNHGRHIPVIMHPVEGIYVPQLIFGELLTSDNYDDSIDRYKIGRNGYGAKLTNIFSKVFMIKIADPRAKLLYSQVWQNGMRDVSQPIIEPFNGEQGFTEITFMPNFGYLYGDLNAQLCFTENLEEYFRNRTMEMSFAAQVVTSFQGVTFDYRKNGMRYFLDHFADLPPDLNIATYISKDGENEMIIADTPNEGWIHAFVNGTPVNLGEHVNEYLRETFALVIHHFDKKFKKKLNVNLIKKHVSIVLRVKLDKPSFNGQIKNKLVNPKPKVTIPATTKKSLFEWKFMDAMMKHFRVGQTKKKKIVGIEKFWNPKYQPANMSKGNDPSERLKCKLILTEGDTGQTLAEKATKWLPGGKDYNGTFPLRGKMINAIRNDIDRVEANKEIDTILKILNADTTVDYYKNPNEALNLRYGGVILLMDADDDGYHITGLFLAFIWEMLKSLLPLGFVKVAYTPVIEGFKRNERITFIYINQFKQWAKNNSTDGWKFNYKKGLGSWSPNPKTVKSLFEEPILLTIMPDENTFEMMELAFNKDCADQRKSWIAGYDPSTPVYLTNPRPVSNFIDNDFRSYSKAAVIRSIPRLMDGMKPSHRKVIYAAFKKFSKYSKDAKYIKMVQFAGFVMEKSGYHHGDASLYATIVHMGQRYLTGPNNLPLIEADGNFGDRNKKGKDASPARYLSLKLSKLAYLIFPKEDFPLMEILEEDGEEVEPKEMYPIIPLALINKTEGISTGWSTKIQPHNPFHIIKWLREWIAEKKSVNNHADYDNYKVDVSNKQTLVPWYKGWGGDLIRIKNEPYEVYRVQGKYNMRGRTVVVTEIPVEMSIQDYKIWGDHMEQLYLTEPQAAYFRTITSHTQSPFIEYHINGCGIPDLAKLNLLSTMSMSNMVLINKNEEPKKYQYTYMIMCEWALERFKIYIKRKEYMLGILREEIKIKTLKAEFIQDLISGRLVLGNKEEAEYIPYMIEKGYPCGKKNLQNIDSNDDDDLEDTKKYGEAKGVNLDFRRIPVGMQTKKNVDKLLKDVKEARENYETLEATPPEDLWIRDLDVLEKEITREYAKPIW